MNKNNVCKILIIVLLFVVLSICCFRMVDSVNQPAISFTPSENVVRTTLVWFEDLVAINGIPSGSGMALADGIYDATLKDGSVIQITVQDGYWYFS